MTRRRGHTIWPIIVAAIAAWAVLVLGWQALSGWLTLHHPPQWEHHSWHKTPTSLA